MAICPISFASGTPRECGKETCQLWATNINDCVLKVLGALTVSGLGELTAKVTQLEDEMKIQKLLIEEQAEKFSDLTDRIEKVAKAKGTPSRKRPSAEKK